MSKKLVYSMVLVVILIGVLSVSINVHEVKAPYPIIFIRADGSIDPPTANITSTDNVTYTFTDNINTSIVVQRSNIAIDGNEYTLQGTGSGFGLNMTTTPTSIVNNVVIKNMRIQGFEYGVYIDYVKSTISENTVYNNSYGIYIRSSSSKILGNSIASNLFGVYFFGGYYPLSSNIIVGNNFVDNLESGIEITGSNYQHSFYHNNFIGNIKHLGYVEYSHFWNTDGEGNYWSNYTGIDSNHDGVGDSPHVVCSFYGYTDNYPLMGPFNSFNTSVGERVDIISNSTINDFKYFESNSTITMHVSNMTANQTHGFCRVSIPYEVMSEPFNVTINGAYPTYWNFALYDNGTHRWIYFEYEHTTREIVIIPEFPSFVILPLFMIATLLAVIVYRGKHTM